MEEEGKNKRIIYEVKTMNIRNEIVSKVKYIMVSIQLFNIPIKLFFLHSIFYFLIRK